MPPNRRQLCIGEYGFLTECGTGVENENAVELPNSAFDYLRRSIQEETSPNDF